MMQKTTVTEMNLMKFCALVAGSFFVSASAFAQVPSHPASAAKRISHYMQESGLTYVETTKKLMSEGLQNADATQMIDSTQPSEVNQYGEVLQQLEDRIQINVASAADKQYLRLLQRTKATAELAVFGDESMLYADCYTSAHETAVRGTLTIGAYTEKKYDEIAKTVREARLKEAQAELDKEKQHLADVENGVPTLTPAQKELCAKDATFTFCAGTPEAKAKFEADKKAKTKELCDKGVFDKDYCAKFEASQGSQNTQGSAPNK